MARWIGTVARVVARIVMLLLALAFLFFGYFKTFAPIDVLAQHHAWTTALPLPVGRAIGVSELAAGLALLAGAVRARWHPFARAAALYLIVNQALAAIVHVSRGETAALPQNAVLVALALFVMLAGRARGAPVQPEEK